jgi:uncharacterized protein YndB with AHSA1/START domain
MSMVWSELIGAPRERVWSALTASGVVQPFYFNSLFEADLAPGGALRYSTPDGKRIFIQGRVLEIVPGFKLVHEFRFFDLAEPPQTVSLELEETSHGTRVTIRHDGLDEAPLHRSRAKRGWSHILRNLKAWLEQGRLPLTTRMQYAVMKLLIPFMPAPPREDSIAPPERSL